MLRNAVRNALRPALRPAIGGLGASDPTAAYAVDSLSPALVSDSANDFFYADGATRTFDEMFTFSRASDAQQVNSSGNLETIASGEPRRHNHIWDGSAWVDKGLLVEPARTNLLHTTDALVTQSHTVTAVPHTLHFTGTGTVTLSGASTAGPLVGTGAGEENRVSLTFTPTAASLTLTVSGTVTNAQLEVGSTPSSYIPNTAGSGTVTRAAETLEIKASMLPDLSAAATYAVSGVTTYADLGGQEEVAVLQRDLHGNYHRLVFNALSSRQGWPRFVVRDTSPLESGGSEIVSDILLPGVNKAFNIAGTWDNSGRTAVAANGSSDSDNQITDGPDLSGLPIGLFTSLGTAIGQPSVIRIWDVGLTDAQLEEATSA